MGLGNSLIDKSDVQDALKRLNYDPRTPYLDAIVKEANDSFDDKNEAVMFLAQTAHETHGFFYIEERDYLGKPGKIATQYGTGAPGKSYHGRGFIQLTWPDNYRAASRALGMGDRLYRNPELVSQDISLAARVSSWYWRDRVRPKAGNMRKFGLTTKAINGALECRGLNVDQSKNRYRIYKAIARATGVENLASECGCYN
ncbi:acidic endochitinase SP2-like [Polistes fuscatus]|uniref:acidic endochitinase SP2-like n=1 Tax=Polistes fuscatus TaxID=30207 RepID=UPI001CAA0CBF|nr:acidic endochitinase SP2-like [Polistes fuscatus]XP_043503993.1 acidic endochitinase SP2-like [Polistes fuscatus]XP_043504759.1 acidic endochitinase SP2-like [Polistes fuscatus]